MLFLAKPLKNYFNKVPDKNAFFAPKRLKMAFAGGVIAYGVTAGCGYKMIEEITKVEDWSLSDFVSVNALRKGGKWGVAMVTTSYIGDVPLIYAAAGALYWRQKSRRTGEKPRFGRDTRAPQL